MSLSIRTNVASLNAQRNLYATQTALDSSLARLSSGFRITRAGDDAAGLGISTKLESQIRSYGQAVRNANDGLSVVQTTEAALNEQASILTRLRELAMQAGSDGVGNSERGYIDTESTRLIAELQRISQVTEYNGAKLLDGSAVTLDFQVGIAATSDDRISLTTLNATTAAAGAGTAAVTVPSAPTPRVTPIIPAFFASAANVYLSTMASNGWDEAAARAAAAGGAPNADAGTQAGNALHEFFQGALIANGGSLAGLATPSTARTAAVQLINDIAAGNLTTNATFAAAIAAYAGSAGRLSTTGAAMTAASDAAILQAGGSSQLTINAYNGADGLFKAAYAAVAGAAPPWTSLTAGAALDAGLNALGFDFVAPVVVTPAVPASSGGLGVAGLSMASKSGALAALASIDSALATVSSNRATLGATGNRLQSAISNIQSFSESLSAANSRIRDVDVAEETSRMSRSQILMQAGVSVLAQANQMPQLALKLLG